MGENNEETKQHRASILVLRATTLMCASLRCWSHGPHPPWSYFHNTISRIFFVIPVMHIYFWSSLCTDPSPHRLLLVIPVRFKGTVKRLKEKRATCFATLLQNELNSIDVARFTNLSTTSSPWAFPLKNGWGGKRPWHWVVTCLY